MTHPRDTSLVLLYRYIRLRDAKYRPFADPVISWSLPQSVSLGLTPLVSTNNNTLRQPAACEGP